jgi:hypothetical protein
LGKFVLETMCAVSISVIDLTWGIDTGVSTSAGGCESVNLDGKVERVWCLAEAEAEAEPDNFAALLKPGNSVYSLT